MGYSLYVNGRERVRDGGTGREGQRDRGTGRDGETGRERGERRQEER